MARRLRPLRRLARGAAAQGLLRTPQPASSNESNYSTTYPIHCHCCWQGNRVVVHRHQAAPGQGLRPCHRGLRSLPSRSATHPQPQLPQQHQSSVTALEDDSLVAIRFLNLVKATLNSTEKFHTMLEILKDFREKLAREDPSADLSETVHLVEELLQDHPQLIVAFREFYT